MSTSKLILSSVLISLFWLASCSSEKKESKPTAFSGYWKVVGTFNSTLNAFETLAMTPYPEINLLYVDNSSSVFLETTKKSKNHQQDALQSSKAGDLNLTSDKKSFLEFQDDLLSSDHSLPHTYPNTTSNKKPRFTFSIDEKNDNQMIIARALDIEPDVPWLKLIRLENDKVQSLKKTYSEAYSSKTQLTKTLLNILLSKKITLISRTDSILNDASNIVDVVTQSNDVKELDGLPNEKRLNIKYLEFKSREVALINFQLQTDVRFIILNNLEQIEINFFPKNSPVSNAVFSGIIEVSTALKQVKITTQRNWVTEGFFNVKSVYLYSYN